jgi:hypothetical protein
VGFRPSPPIPRGVLRPSPKNAAKRTEGDTHRACPSAGSLWGTHCGTRNAAGLAVGVGRAAKTDRNEGVGTVGFEGLTGCNPPGCVWAGHLIL